MATLQDIIESFEGRGDQIAFIYKKEDAIAAFTYREMLALARGAANYFAKTGLKKGDRVILWGENSPYWVSALLGALLAGLTAVPMDIRGGARFVEKIHELTKASLILCDFSKKAGLKSGRRLMTFDELAAVAENFPPRFSGRDSLPSDHAAVFFTSGTVAVPKGVVLTHGNIRAEVEALHRAAKGFSPNERLLSLLPLSHIFEQVIGLWFPLRRGYSVTYLQHIKPSAIFESLEKNEITLMPVVPRILKVMEAGIMSEVNQQGKKGTFILMTRLAPHLPLGLRRHLFPPIKKKFGKLKYFLVGGAALSPQQEFFWENIGIPLLQGYGLTETSSVVTCNVPGSRRLCSIGRALSGTEVKLSAGKEILVKGAAVFRGYYENSAKTREAFEGEWFKTGDLGDFDRAGYLYFRGRKKDLIVTADGLNVYPDDIEGVLNHITGVKDSCVFGVNRRKGEIVHACLLLERPEEGAGRIIREANKHLEPHQTIKEASVWPEKDFPRTPTAKILKREVSQKIIKEFSPRKMAA